MVFACLAALALLAPAATSGQDPSKDPRGILFRQAPVLSEVVQICGETSPLRNSCIRDVNSEACRLGCSVVERPGFAYTGYLTAIIHGKGSDGSSRWVASSCGYAAGSRTNVAGLGTGDCFFPTNAEHVDCGDAKCVVLWPPLRLEGRSAPLAGAAAGSWAVTVQR